MEEEWIKILAIIGSNVFALIGCYALSMKMWMHMDKKIDCIHSEMCDFHVRLEKLDADYKSHMMFYHSNHESNKVK